MLKSLAENTCSETNRGGALLGFEAVVNEDLNLHWWKAHGTGNHQEILRYRYISMNPLLKRLQEAGRCWRWAGERTHADGQAGSRSGSARSNRPVYRRTASRP